LEIPDESFQEIIEGGYKTTSPKKNQLQKKFHQKNQHFSIQKQN